jgi:hypothetical protein
VGFRVIEDISMTARVHSAHRTGVLALVLDALALSRYDSISPSMLYGACIATPSMHDDGCYTQNLKYVAYLFSPRQHARCIARTRPHTHVCFERVTTHVEISFTPPIGGGDQCGGGPMRNGEIRRSRADPPSVLAPDVPPWVFCVHKKGALSLLVKVTMVDRGAHYGRR